MFQGLYQKFLYEEYITLIQGLLLAKLPYNSDLPFVRHSIKVTNMVF